ncbi:hypothetical protein DMZ43_04350 [Meridianimaribacter sp. CL38]|nr:hypothetical protein DMZ43_04350 [Meridianimaribacter sp. CL38]
MALLIYFSAKNIKKLKQINRTPRVIYFLLILWCVITIIRGFSLNLQDWITNLGNIYMAPAWLTPLFLIIGVNLSNWSKAYKAISFMLGLMVFFFFLSFIFPFKYPQWSWLLRPVNLAFIVFFYRSNILNKTLFFLATIAYLFITDATSHRVDYIFFALSITFVLIDKASQVNLRKLLFWQVIIIYVLVLLVIFLMGYAYFADTVNLLVEYQDSRTFLFTELFTELNKNEYYYGRGSLGTYYSDFFERTTRYYHLKGNTGWKGDEPERITIEVGYLQMILKGGFIMFFLHLYFMLYGVYLGIFKSKNKFTRRLGVFILIITILSIISFRPRFTPIFIFLWMAIGTVLNKKNREMNDEEINNLLK